MCALRPATRADQSFIAWRRTKGLMRTRKATAVRKKAKRRKTSGVTAVTVRSSNYRVNSGELRPHWRCA